MARQTLLEKCRVEVSAQISGSSKLPFSSALSTDELMEAFSEEDRKNPQLFRDNGPYAREATLFAFLDQVLQEDSSCRAAVQRLSIRRATQGLSPIANSTSSYCKAREKLSVDLIARLARQVSRSVEDELPSAWLWHDRPVAIFDASMVTADDTPASRAVFPEHHGHRKGLGLPSLRLVAATSLSTGMVKDLEIGAYEGGSETSEMTLALKLARRCLGPGDIAVADRYYCAYGFIGQVLLSGADFVGRLGNGRRKADFRRGKRLGNGDHLITIKRPPRSAKSWWNEDFYGTLPDEITLREVKVEVGGSGEKKRSIVVVTTLLDPEAWPTAELGPLYRRRWHIELDFRCIKTVMGINHLRCRTPAMLLKEIWVTALAYNLVRRMMAQAAHLTNQLPRELSFKGCVQAMNAHMDYWLLPNSRLSFKSWYESLLSTAATMRIPKRPGRSEPRQIKRSPKKFDMLKEPRTKAREQFEARS